MNKLLFIAGLFLFLIEANAQQITLAEYFIDEDPGVGNGIPIGLNIADDTVEAALTINTELLSTGEHLLVIRVKDDNGNWSLSNYSRFYVEENYTIPVSQNLNNLEFFIDNDPGIGNGTTLVVSEDSSYLNLNGIINTTGLSAGNHKLAFRTRDAEGNWSLSNYSQFYLEADYSPYIPSPEKIKKVEYFIDGPDPGFHQADSIIITPSFLVEASDTLLLSADTSELGRHAVLARVLSENDEWSLTAIGEYDYCAPEGVLGGFSYEKDNNKIAFTDSSKYAVNYIWDMDNGDSLYTNEPIYTYSQGGIYEICQTVYSFCDTTITCKTVNFPTPRITDSIPNITIEEDSQPIVVSKNLNLVFSDGDNDPLSFSAFSTNENILVTIEENEVSIGSTNNFFGEALLIVEAEGGGVSAFDTVKVSVTSINYVPEAKKPFTNLLWDEDSGPRILSTRLSNRIVDIEDRRLAFDFLSDTSGLMPIFYNDTLALHLAPHFHGEGNISILATDDSLATSTFTFNIKLLPLPDAPLLTKPFQDITLFEDSEPYLLTESLSSFFSEPDSQKMIFSLFSGDEGVSLSLINDSLWISTLPDYEGETEAIITASDGELITSDTFNIIVLPENDAPQFSINQDFEVCPQTPLAINLQEIVSDKDGFFDDIQFKISLAEVDQPSIIENEINFEISPDKFLLFSSESVEAGNIKLILETTDLQNASNDTTITIVVNGASITQSGDTLIASSGSTYKWYKGGNLIEGVNSSKYIPTLRDFYQVEVTKNGCNTLSEPFQVTAFDSQLPDQSVTVHPNPVLDLLLITISNPFIGNFSYKITNVYGKTILSGNYRKDNFDQTFELNTKRLSAGMYFLILDTETDSIAKKLYKK